ncbi:nuclear transport factor 2 family protein [Mycobacterium nebraskense]|uniref:Polyketide cyclase n=1 Tax=Mycobacterium nebraskense TaxID=244292 RepID=A0A0F5NIB6_9MYCO|nr:nuclear transport factor 2 family protein [Mycobacterium nebraskense]KKC06789.1 polyketide cyclase [Mycobacterium nebraskense]KLO45629.1 polyketide cyclase [Mycobacterium nebraskense]MBI2694972.1 nuclear transport factor 2 family protein [Mycobacterium nebraskense]MCV7121210.1 nuclear transport factor 2 family protein [Mycobacterium nebraskense]ORW14071.1 polyketide cyclase [Mycobacterium nebraskense]
MAATRTAREVVELYNLVVWNEHNLTLAEELFADTVIRHEVGEAHTLTREQAVSRVKDVWAMFDKLRFDLNIVASGDDGEHVAIVYDSSMTTKDGTETNVASIEVFRVVDGKITEVWNCGYKQGVWS